MLPGKQITAIPIQEETSLEQKECDTVVSTAQRNLKKSYRTVNLLTRNHILLENIL